MTKREFKCGQCKSELPENFGDIVLRDPRTGEVKAKAMVCSTECQNAWVARTLRKLHPGEEPVMVPVSRLGAAMHEGLVRAIEREGKVN